MTNVDADDDCVLFYVWFVDFDVVSDIPTASFSFGGQTGNKESVVVFRRKLSSDAANAS